MIDELGNEINITYSNDTLIGEGYFGRVYRINRDTCFKKFLCEQSDITRENLLKIKSWSNYPSMYTIKNLCFNKNTLKGYLMQYYETLDIRLMTRRYIYESYFRTLELLKKVSDEHYILGDLHGGNIIMTHSGIVLIDCDDMDYSHKDAHSIFENNEDNLRYAIGYYISDRARKEYLDTFTAQEIFQSLTDGNIHSFNQDKPLFKIYR